VVLKWTFNEGLPLSVGSLDVRIGMEEIYMSELPRGQALVVVPTKSMGIAIMLTLFFGPLGMLYSTIVGALVMFIATLLALFFTAGLGLLVTWPVCIIWAAVATNDYNKKLLGTAGA
jgi:hypothetical protein